TTTIVYMMIFPALIKLRYSHGHVPRPYKIPGGMIAAWVVTILTTGWAILATVALLYPGFGTSDPDSSLLEGFEGQRGAFEALQFILLAVLIGLGLVFYWLGAPTRRRQVEVSLIDEQPVAVATTT